MTGVFSWSFWSSWKQTGTTSGTINKVFVSGFWLGEKKLFDMSPWRMACDSCSMHKLGLIGREMSLTLTVAAVRTMCTAACYVKWHCCTFWQQRAKTQRINYMVECALVQQTHTVNTYVSCRSSLHSNPQHPNTCLRRSTAPEVGCFHGNQAAAFDDGSHEMTPADSAGSSESPRGRIDGWMGEWVVVVGGVAERKCRKWSERQLPLAENELHNRSTARLTFAARVLLPGTKAGSDKNTVSQMRRSSNGSQPHHMTHVDSCVINFLGFGCEGRRNI